jgi:hypothetical protein
MPPKKNPASAGTLGGAGIRDLAACGSVPKQNSKTHGQTPPEARLPVIVDLQRAGDGLWRLTLDGGVVLNLQTEQLQRYRRFASTAAAQADVNLSKIPNNDWLALVDDALRPLREARQS